MRFTKPEYCPDAIATDAGWVNPKSGELLVAIRNLPQKIAEQNYKKVEEPIVIEEETTQDKNSSIVKTEDGLTLNIQDTIVVESTEQKKKAGRPKKVI